MVSFSPFSTGPFGVPPIQSTDANVPTRIVRKVFEGSKNLWRQRIFAEIVIFLHEKLPSARSALVSDYKPVCVEVVVFNPAVGAEAPHLFLSYTKLCQKFHKNIAKFEKERTTHSQSTKKFVEDLIVTYLLNRIGAKSSSNSTRISSASERVFEVFLAALDDDTGDSEMLINRPSTLLADLPDLQKYRVVKMTVDESKKEFNSKLLLLHQESIIVNADYEKAVRMSNLTTTAIKCFEALKDRKIRSYSIHRKRWIRAIDQVLLQNRALRAKGPVERVLVTTPRKRPMSIAAAPSSSRPRPACRRPSVIVVDEDTDSEKCHSECSTAADDGNGEEIDVPFKSKSFLDTAESRSSARDRDTQAQLLRAELFLNNVPMRNGIRSHSMIGVIPVRDPPHIPKLDIRQFGRQQRSCSVEMMAPRCNDEKEHSRRMFKESFQSVFSRTGPLIPSQRIAPIGLSRTMTIKPSTMKSFSGFSDVVSSPSNGPHSMEATGSGSFNGPVLRAMGTLPPLVDLAGDANARIRANKRFNMRS